MQFNYIEEYNPCRQYDYEIVIGANLREYKPPVKADCDIRVPKQYATIQAGVDAAVNPNTRSDTGITLDAGVPNGLIQRNVFNTTGTTIASITPNGTSLINENNFNSNTAIKVSNGWPTTVHAENNWWGDLDPSDNVQGSVDYTPFATSPFTEH